MRKCIMGLLKNNNKQHYEAPRADVLVIEPQGLLCASGGVATGGGTESMTMTDVNWP